MEREAENAGLKPWPGFTEKKERYFLVVLSVAAALAVCALFLIYRNENNAVRFYNRNTFQSGAIGDIRYDVESVTADEKNNSTIKGWFVKPGVTYDFYNYGNDAERTGVYNYLNVCLIDADRVYVLPTKLEIRQDVNDLIGDGTDYKFSGFEAYVPSKYSYLFDNCSYGFLSRDPDGRQTLYAMG
ncbi:MAG: hypothetical protein LIV24_01470 [Eubacterium sp.]|nr:hypothetical protein [Eubacterium sp.]